jgi:fumarate hydratase class II
MMAKTRVERDSLGEIRVPDEALYGAQTQRAVENFPISGLRMPRPMLRALGLIKRAAARVNADLGLLQRERAEAIARAADELVDGALDGHFPVDVFQTGSGTSTNMNANEVLARRASQILGSPVHPNDHVNLGQSSNDVIPTAIHVAALETTTFRLLPALRALEAAFARKATEYGDVIKVGRTHMQDATPVRLGQELGGYAAMLELGAARIERSATSLCELPLGGTAVGTGINTHAEFPRRAAAALSAATGLQLLPAGDCFEALGARGAAVELSGQLRGLSVSLYKITTDLRWLGSGPRAGLGELKLPELQPGSSIMPGKVNPVIPEAVAMVCAQVMGHDAAIAFAGAAGTLELNTMMPLIAYDLLQSIELLANACHVLSEKCVNGLEADRERCAAQLEGCLALATALAPRIGYDRAAAIAQRAWAESRTVREVAREESGLSEEELVRILDPRAMTERRIPG